MRHYDKNYIYKIAGVTTLVRNQLYRNTLTGLEISSICEVGIGSGYLARYCRENGIAWVGIEPNEKSRNVAIADGFKVYDGTIPVFPEISEKFDAIVASHVIEHLNNAKEVLEFMKVSQKILEECGGKYLILLYPDIEKWGNFFWVDYTHSFVTTKKRIEDMLLDTNWHIVRSERYLGCFFKTSSFLHAIFAMVPYLLLPEKIGLFIHSLKQSVLTIGAIKNSTHNQNND